MAAKNLGESQNYPIRPYDTNDALGNFTTDHWGKERNIVTTGGTGQSRNYSHFYKSHRDPNAQKFIDTKDELTKSVTEGRV